jgi:hypothetical protein
MPRRAKSTRVPIVSSKEVGYARNVEPIKRWVNDEPALGNYGSARQICYSLSIFLGGEYMYDPNIRRAMHSNGHRVGARLIC